MSENNDDTTVVTISNHTASDLLIADDGYYTWDASSGIPDNLQNYGLKFGDWVLYKDHTSMELELAEIHTNQAYGTYMYDYVPKVYIAPITGPNSTNYRFKDSMGGDIPVSLLEISVKSLTKVPKNSTLETARLLYGKPNS